MGGATTGDDSAATNDHLKTNNHSTNLQTVFDVVVPHLIVKIGLEIVFLMNFLNDLNNDVVSSIELFFIFVFFQSCFQTIQDISLTTYLSRQHNWSSE